MNSSNRHDLIGCYKRTWMASIAPNHRPTYSVMLIHCNVICCIHSLVCYIRILVCCIRWGPAVWLTSNQKLQPGLLYRYSIPWTDEGRPLCLPSCPISKTILLFDLFYSFFFRSSIFVIQSWHPIWHCLMAARRCTWFIYL